MLSIIVNVSENWGIGRDNRLLFRISDDLRRVKELTDGKTIIMGKNTFLSLPKTLPNRRHIVITRDKGFCSDDANVAVKHDLWAAISPFMESAEEAFIFGGASVYEQAMPFCHKIYLTKVLQAADADTFFPAIDPRAFTTVMQSDIMTDGKTGLGYVYITYERAGGYASSLNEILRKNAVLFDIILKSRELGVKDYYVGAGCIMQTVWNYQLGNDPMYGVSDVDIVYFDGADLSYEAEDAVIKRADALFAGCGVKVDVKNEARVHLWYEERFGYAVPPYRSIEEAIGTWPATASAAGVRIEDGELAVCAPFGLDDMFNQTVRANKARITEEVYRQKTEKWKSRWPSLTVIPW